MIVLATLTDQSINFIKTKEIIKTLKTRITIIWLFDNNIKYQLKAISRRKVILIAMTYYDLNKSLEINFLIINFKLCIMLINNEVDDHFDSYLLSYFNS